MNNHSINNQEAIFPLISIDPETKIWKCVGTGFFIESSGYFVTAKHIFYNNDGSSLQTLYGVQTTSNNEYHLRSIITFSCHPNADIAIGLLGGRRIPGKDDQPPEPGLMCALDFTSVNQGDNILSFAFPLSQNEHQGGTEFKLTFKSAFAYGNILEYLSEGSPIIRNRCFVTDMNIEHGASGGPVIRGDYVIGINSSRMNFSDQPPISYITQIDFILDLSVIEKSVEYPVKFMVNSGFLICKE